MPILGKQHWAHHACDTCGDVTEKANEKETDVNFAMNVLEDALNDKFDIAYLVTADSDFVPLVKRIRQMPRKQVIVFFPPERASNDLRNACDDARPLWKSLIRASQLPDSVTKANGVVLQKPAFWVGPKQTASPTQPLPRWGRLAITRLARRLLCWVRAAEL